MGRILLSICTSIFLCVTSIIQPPSGEYTLHTLPENLFGITIDDCYTGSIDDLTDAISALPVKPIIRLVFDHTRSARSYLAEVKQLHQYAYICGCVYDSSAEKCVSRKTHLKRWTQYVNTLKSYVDLWEVGNEVNGNWLGRNSKLLSEKISDAWRYCHKLHLKTALTAYAFRPQDQAISMESWLERYIPKQMKKNLDYVFVSFYDDDNTGYHPDWVSITDSLEQQFPKASVGIGECGFAKPHAYDNTYIERVKEYYEMGKLSSRFVGGYFWWNWAEDCVPYKQNPAWELFASEALQSPLTTAAPQTTLRTAAPALTPHFVRFDTDPSRCGTE